MHWRRGDQLTTRCKIRQDVSVNCQSANQLIKMIKRYTSNNITYIATNENSHSKELEILRRNGYKLSSDVSLLSLQNISLLAIEVSLMLDSDIFLSWGVSEISDVVEHERSMRNKSFCITNDGKYNLPNVSVNVNSLTYCNKWFRQQLNNTSNSYRKDNMTIDKLEKLENHFVINNKTKK